MRAWIAPVFVLLFPVTSFPCSFCSVNTSDGKWLSKSYRQASAVVYGTYKNGKLGNDLTSGTTELHVEKILQSHDLLPKERVIVVPRYIPGETKSIVFFFKSGDKIEPTIGMESNDILVSHVERVMKLDPKNSTEKLAYYYSQLDSPNAEVSLDAFMEFATASDAEILKARDRFDPKKLVTMLRDPKTQPEKLGMLAMMLGMCGQTEHFTALRDALQTPLKESVSTNLGGYLCGWVLLDPAGGWVKLESMLFDTKLDPGLRLSCINAVRFFQANRPREYREKIVFTYGKLAVDATMADLVVEDLRRWRWWDLHDVIYKSFDLPSHKAPVLQRAIVRYALTANDDKSRAFITHARQKDPQMVAKVEERLKD